MALGCVLLALYVVICVARVTDGNLRGGFDKVYLHAPDLFEEGYLTTVPMVTQGNVVDVNAVLYKGLYISEGDIILGSILQSLIHTGVRWNCPVPYEISPTIQYASKIVDAIAHWEEHTGWRFVKRTDECDYIVFQDSDGCSSWQGRHGGAQPVFVGAVCNHPALVHEIGHALGLYHEHRRLDRDRYIKVNEENIDPDLLFAFDQISTSIGDDFGEYDFASIMHYELYAYSINGEKTITPIADLPDGITEEDVGNRESLSPGDIAGSEYMIGLSCQGEPTAGQSSDGICDVELTGVDAELHYLSGIYRYDGTFNDRPFYADLYTTRYIWWSAQFSNWHISKALADSSPWAYAQGTEEYFPNQADLAWKAWDETADEYFDISLVLQCAHEASCRQTEVFCDVQVSQSSYEDTNGDYYYMGGLFENQPYYYNPESEFFLYHINRDDLDQWTISEHLGESSMFLGTLFAFVEDGAVSADAIQDDWSVRIQDDYVVDRNMVIVCADLPTLPSPETFVPVTNVDCNLSLNGADTVAGVYTYEGDYSGRAYYYNKNADVYLYFYTGKLNWHIHSVLGDSSATAYAPDSGSEFPIEYPLDWYIWDDGVWVAVPSMELECFDGTVAPEEKECNILATGFSGEFSFYNGIYKLSQDEENSHAAYILNDEAYLYFSLLNDNWHFYTSFSDSYADAYAHTNGKYYVTHGLKWDVWNGETFATDIRIITECVGDSEFASSSSKKPRPSMNSTVPVPVPLNITPVQVPVPSIPDMH